MQSLRFVVIAIALAVAFGCSSSATPIDSDSGITALDASATRDAGGAPDSEVRPTDAGRADAGRPVDGGRCEPPTADASKIGMACETLPRTCDPGYTCTAFSGVRLSYTCEIPCRADCECPGGKHCTPRVDKGGSTLLCH